MRLAKRVLAYIVLFSAFLVLYGFLQEGEPNYDLLADAVLVLAGAGVLHAMLELLSS